MAEHFEGAGHLPNNREQGDARDPDELPRQRRGTTPQMHGRYPDFDVLSQAGHWDALTRSAILDRVAGTGPLRFFDEGEARTLGAFCDVVLAQDREPRVPVLAMVDAKLADGKLDGFQYDDMPDDRDTWRQVARGLDESAADHGAPSFAQASDDDRREIVQAFSEGKLEGGVWDALPADRAFGVVMRAVLSAFYSHPWAWNEIGFGGPAYPRGYARLGIGQREHWEGAEAVNVDPVADTGE